MAIARTPEQEQIVKDNLTAICAEVFFRDGYSKVTMKSLADEAGCTTGKFYSNFSGKPEILNIVIEKLVRSNYLAVDKMLKKGDTATIKIMLLFVLQYEICRVNEKIGELFYYGYEDTEAVLSVAGWLKEELAAALTADYGRKEADNDLLFRSMMCLKNFHAIIIRERKGFGYDEDRQLKDMMNMLLDACGIAGKDADAIRTRVEKERETLRDTTYNVIINILQTRLI